MGVGAPTCPVHGRTAVHQGSGEPESRFYQIAHRISDTLSPRIEQGFMEAVDRLQRQIDMAELRAQVAGGNPSQIEAAAGAGRLQAVLLGGDALRGTFQDAATITGRKGAEVLEGVTGLDAQFNRRHPNVVLFAREQAADLVVQVGDDVKETIRIVTAAGADFGVTPDEQARMIRGVLGLRPDHAMAPTNFRQELRDGRLNSSRRLSAVDQAKIRSRIARGTMTEEFIQEMVETYEFRLLNYRAQSIARTESLRAAHHGQREAWRQGVDQGVLPKTVRRIAVVTPDDRLRDTHAQVPGMNPDGVALDEPFDTPFGPLPGPPWETNCRCGEGLIFPGQPGVI